MKFTTYRLSDVVGGRNNNFDLLRLLAALAVMFGHSFWIQPAAGRSEPVQALLGLEYSGSLSVYAFFLISGMLISASYARQASPLKFCALRFGRIYPAYIACVVLSAFVVYPISTHSSVLDGLSNGYAIRYVKDYALMFVGADRNLPHAFQFNAIRHVINGSLWTLPVEAKCYAVVLVAGIFGLIRSTRGVILASAALLAGLAWMVAYQGALPFALADLARMENAYAFYPVAFFAFGMGLYGLRDRVVLAWPVAVALWLAFACLYATPLRQVALYVAFVYGLLWLSSTTTLVRFRPRADLSYGTYLWGFPVQQLVAAAHPSMDNLLGLLISVPLTLLLASLSWALIEKPCLTLTKQLCAPKAITAYGGAVPTS